MKPARAASEPAPAESPDRVGSRATDARITAARRRGIDVLEVGGGPALAMPDHVRAAARRAMEAPGPRPSRGLGELRVAIAELLATRSARAIDAEREIVVTNGAMQALNLVCRALLEPGDRVVVPTPNFFFDGVIRLAQGIPIYVPSPERERWAWDLDALAAAIDGRTKAILFSNPTNPTGYLPSREELSAVLDLAEAHDAVVISDESYDRFVYPEASMTSLASLGAADSAVLVNSLSKSYALADWRMGYVVAPVAVADTITKLLEWEMLHCGYVAQKVAEAAIRGPQDWIEAAVAGYAEKRDAVLDAVSASPWLSSTRPAATPFLFLDATALAPHGAPVDVLLEGGVATVPGNYFQAPEHYLRLPFGGDRSTISRLVEAIATFEPGR